MKASLVQLNNYVFLKTEINLNPSFNLNKSFNLKAEYIDCQLQSAIGKDEQFFAELKLSIDPGRHVEANLPYKIELAAVGQVSVDKSYDKDQEELAVINGATLIYSAMREHLLYLTSRYPNGTILLPVVDFRGLKKSK
ncbi:MAG: hypothetical protein GX569_14255 [Candidatus Riflebacteria bacterium]|nr:hypothetical protein [Candidatus Riflebacteria bacterium]